MAVDGFLGFKTVAGDAENNALVAGDFPAFDELTGAGDGDASSGLGKNAGVFSEVADAANYFLILAVVGTATGFVHAADGVVAVRRSADGEGFHNRVRF